MAGWNRLSLVVFAGCLAVEAAWAAPGDHFDVRPDTLPAPHTTHPDNLDMRIVPAPAYALPQGPPGFEVKAFSERMENPRSLAVAPNGDVYVVQENRGIVTRLRDTNGDGKADEMEDFAAGFRGPHGIAIRGDYIYIADTIAVWRAKYKGNNTVDAGRFQRLTTAHDLRPGGEHDTRDIVLDSKGRIYLAIGGRNDLSEPKSFEGTIQMVNDDGSLTPFATGLRNVEGLAFYPGTDDLWVTVNERNKLGARLPPDYFARVKQGDFFGWPYAYAGPNPDPDFGALRPDLVKATRKPEILFEAHSAPLGLVFYTGKQFPPQYRGDAFVALHGSGPYDKPDGYKIVRIRFKNGKPLGGYEDFVTGFANAGIIRLSVWGMPSQLAVAKDGSLLIADDTAARVWRVFYKGPPPP
ncbi:MAG TPA: PQQ-dependent sugar dehydrogenase [Rhizomicrobium sp.]|nr:PQQ-dependent sugar dehydrogenase [Rhizomicrobium sp.]